MVVVPAVVVVVAVLVAVEEELPLVLGLVRSLTRRIKLSPNWSWPEESAH